jgi:hypothetical protein
MIIKNKIKSFLIYFFFVTILFNLNLVQAQLRNDSNLYIGDNSVLYVDVQTFDFGSGTTKTSRTKLYHGILALSNNVSWLGANDKHFIDGYARTYSTNTFVLPIGQFDIYAPIQVTASNPSGVDAAYFRLPANSIGTVFEKSISAISTVEYWDINSKGTNAKISLSWSSSSAISALTSYSLANLTMIGWNGSKWVVILSTVDQYSMRGESSLTSGSISSNSEVDLSVFSAFSLGATKTEQIPTKTEFIIYINQNKLYIESSARISDVEIYDIMGNRVISEKVATPYKYNMPFQYEEAVYVALIKFEGGVIKTQKIINSRIIH